VSIQDLRPNPQDTTAFYLTNIYQLLADPNISHTATPAIPPPFSPPRYAVWVNSLWLLSLVISLTCALLATLLQQWARRYLTVTQPPRLSPHKRARIRSFFAGGAKKFHLPLVVETLPTLLHVSLFLFFSGLLVFLFNINHTTFSIVAWWVGLCGGIYGCITLLPIFRHDSPYYAPLTFLVWSLLNGVSYEVFRILTFITNINCFTFETYFRFLQMRGNYRIRTSRGIVRTAQERASKLSAEFDYHVFARTFWALDEDHELEQFFEAIPAFSTSQVVHEPKRIFAKLNVRELGFPVTAACNDFLIRTFSFHLLSESIKERRFILCMRALDALDSPFPSHGFTSQVFGPPAMDGVLQSVQMGHLLRRRSPSSNGKTALYAQMLVAGIIASAPERDDSWKLLVMDQLRISKGVLEDYLTHGDSVLLANWIHITPQSFPFYREDFLMSKVLGNIQSTISKFDIRDTLPGLQHDFCALWNKLRNEKSYYLTDYVLRPNRHHFIALHQGTDAVPTPFDASTDDDDPILRRTLSYPLCNILGHHSDSATDDITHSLIHPPDPDLNNIALAAPDVPSVPAFTPDHSRINQSSPHGVPPSHATPTIQSSHLSPPVNTESNDFATTLPEPALIIAIESHTDTPSISPMDNSGSDTRPAMTTISPPSLSLPSRSSIDNTDLQIVPPLVPDDPSSPSPIPVSTDTLPADLLISSASPISQIDLIISGSRLLTQGSVPEISFTPPQVTSDVVEASQQAHEPERLSLDTATDLSRHPADTAPSRDVDCT
jgi:Family of unknown function (DUF6535)